MSFPLTGVTFNLLCHDIDKMLDFYRECFQLEELMLARSPIYRVLVGEGVRLGFNAPRAYELLDLTRWKKSEAGEDPVAVILTFTVDRPDLVEVFAVKAASAGGQLVKAPFQTYYGHWQVVARDPEGNVVRVTSTQLPTTALL